MSDAPEQQVQADDAQAQAGGTDANQELLNKISLLEANNRKLLSEKKNAASSVEDLQRQVSELQAAGQKEKQAKLQESGEFKTLWQEASGTVSSLQDQLAQKDQAIEELKAQFQQAQIKTTALNAMSQSGVHSPDHMFQLLKDNLRMNADGQPVALVGGVETDLVSHLESLKSPGSGMDYFFAGSGARGMSASGTSTSTGGQKSWASMSVTERIQMEQSDLENGTQHAQRLKAAG